MTSPIQTTLPQVLSIIHSNLATMPAWQGPTQSLILEKSAIYSGLLDLSQPLFILANNQGTALSHDRPSSYLNGKTAEWYLAASAPSLLPETLGDPNFCQWYGTRYAYYGGAMANAIASTAMVIALGKAGFLGSFGAAGMVAPRLEAAIQEIQAALPNGPYMFNLINSPNEPAMERHAVELYLQHNVTAIEASAYLDLTIPLVHYRVAGFGLSPTGEIKIRNRVIAKVSRKEVARRFLEPAPADILNTLLQEGKITELQAKLAQSLPIADDITVEADSGGHTDNRPLVGLLPTMLALRDEIQTKYAYAHPVRIGAGGGISTPESALAAFMMGAAYIVTGSINQACVESGASEHTKNLLAQADMADVTMAPAADMFEMGVKVQLLKRGTMFPIRAQKLYEIYSRYNSIEEIPADEAEKIQRTILKRSFAEIWTDTVTFFSERDPRQIERAERDPHQKMALIFRWYLGLSSRWSNSGEKGREMDYQIWCGPSMGSFNEWTRGTYLAEPANRHVVDAAMHIMTGAAYLARLRMLELQGVRFPVELLRYIPTQPIA